MRDYQKSLEKARELHKTSSPEVRLALEKVFTELVEDEDEKIRNGLIGYFQAGKCENISSYHGISTNDIIAWLEKQGEKTPDKIVEKARTEKQRVLLTETDGNASIDWDCRSLDDVKTLLKCGLEFIRTIEANKQTLTDSRFGGCSFCVPTRYDKGIKQGEQKPTDKVESKFKVGDIISNGISEVKIVSIGKDNYTVTNGEIENHAHIGNWVVYFKDQDNWKLVEQKSSWSEGDEEIVEALNDYVKNLDILFSKINIGGKDVLSKEFREKVQHWLKSIKDRVQPKQE